MAVSLNTNNMQSSDFMPSDARDYFKTKMRKKVITSIISSGMILIMITMMCFTVYQTIFSKDASIIHLSKDGEPVSIAEMLQTEGVAKELMQFIINDLGIVFIIMISIMALIFLCFVFSSCKALIVNIMRIGALNSDNFEYSIAKVTDRRVIRRNKSTRKILELDNMPCRPLSNIDFYNCELGMDCYMCKINIILNDKYRYAFPVDFKNLPQNMIESFRSEFNK